MEIPFGGGQTELVIELKRDGQLEAAGDAIVEIMGRTGNTPAYHDMLAALDNFDPKKVLTPEEDTFYREAFAKLYGTFGNLAPLVREFWQGSASVREKYNKLHKK
jgi:hypothetical protein